MYLLTYFIYSTHKTGTTSSGIFFFSLFDLVCVSEIETLFPEDKVCLSALLGPAPQCVNPSLWVHEEQPGTQVPS